MPGGVTKEVSQFKPSPSVPMPLFPSPNKLCHLSYLLELHKERYVGPQLASNMKDVRYNVRRCNTLGRVAELLEKRESAKPANVTGRFDAISVWPTEQVMARRARGGGFVVEEEGVARAGARSQQLHCNICRWHVAWKGNVGARGNRLSSEIIENFSHPIPPLLLPHTHTCTVGYYIRIWSPALLQRDEKQRAMTLIICPCMSLHVCACLCTYVYAMIDVLTSALAVSQLFCLCLCFCFCFVSFFGCRPQQFQFQEQRR